MMHGSCCVGLLILSHLSIALADHGFVLHEAGDKPKAVEEQVANGVQLTLAVPNPKATLTAAGHFAEPLVMKMIVTNVSEKAIKLNTFDLFWVNLDPLVTGPDAMSFELSDIRPRIGPRNVKPVPADFPVIQAGESWTREIKLVSEWGPGRDFTFRKSGTYRIKLSFRGFGGEGCWSGTVVSNEVTIEVGPAIKK